MNADQHFDDGVIPTFSVRLEGRAGAKDRPNPAPALETLISAEEIGRDRTPDEFIAWFESFLEKTRLDRSHRAQILLRQGIAKPVYEEVFPLYRLLGHKRRAWNGRLFRNILGGQSHDVVVTGAELASPAYMEITVADVDQAETVRMEAFAATGRVPAIVPVSWTGTRNTGRVVNISEDMIPHDSLVQRKKEQLIDAIQRKANRSYGEDTSLLVYFDDYTVFTHESDLPAIREVLDVTRSVWQGKFAALYLVGASGKRFWEEDRPQKRPD